MRGYCRAFHTSMDYLAGMPVARLIDELADANEQLAEEQRALKKQLDRDRARPKTARPRKRR